MQLAARIENLMKAQVCSKVHLMVARSWSKMQFAEKLNKKPDQITKLLSGTQNLTIDELVEIAHVFNIKITTLFKFSKKINK